MMPARLGAAAVAVLLLLGLAAWAVDAASDPRTGIYATLHRPG